MLSKNNWKEQVRQQEPKKQRFTIKKLTIGVASVLIGFTFMGMSASADAQTQSTTDTPADMNTSSMERESNTAHMERESNTAQSVPLATRTPATSAASDVKNNADTTTPIAPSTTVPSYDGTKVVDTPFYNNSRGTNSNLIDNQSKTGQYTFYFTAKDASGKEYAVHMLQKKEILQESCLIPY